MSLPRYPKYKDSGVAWLGEVPEHWAVVPLKRNYEVCLGKMLQNDASGEEDVLLPYLRAANVQWGSVDITDVKLMWLSPRDQRQLRLKTNDLLVSEGGDVGRSAIWRGEFDECYIQNSVNRVRGKGGSSTKFLFYWMATIKSKGYVDVLCNKSTIAHFTAEKVAEVPVPFPSEQEQSAIAAFLDRETGKIDTLIAEQERLLALLAEKRQATISHAVTKGLNPDVPMKDSEVEWLGKVPVRWKVTAVKRLAKTGTKTFIDGDWIESPYITNEGIRLIQTGNVGIGYYKEQGFRYVSEEAFSQLGCTEVKPHDVLICRLDGPVGRACLAPDLGVRAITSVDNAILKCAEDVMPEFVVYLFSSLPWISWIDVLCRVGGGFRLRISRSQLGELRIPLPPLEEQFVIVTSLYGEIARLDALTVEATRAIELLKERRTALISAAVTGKIDVRVQVEPEAA